MYDDLATFKDSRRRQVSNWNFRQAELDRREEEGRKEGVKQERERMRQEAIKAGVAEYVIVDRLTGRTEFRWKKSL